jgi:hypothetical protein
MVIIKINNEVISNISNEIVLPRDSTSSSDFCQRCDHRIFDKNLKKMYCHVTYRISNTMSMIDHTCDPSNSLL